MKLCKDCKHYQCNWISLWQPKCGRNKINFTDPVTGKDGIYINHECCYQERASTTMEEQLFGRTDRCGIEGKYWEEKT